MSIATSRKSMTSKLIYNSLGDRFNADLMRHMMGKLAVIVNVILIHTIVNWQLFVFVS